MTFSQSLIYVLQKAPLWWIRFWLRPFEFDEKIEKNDILELIAAILCGLFWGSIFGIIFWLQTGNAHFILLIVCTSVVVVVSVITNIITNIIVVVTPIIFLAGGLQSFPFIHSFIFVAFPFAVAFKTGFTIAAEEEVEKVTTFILDMIAVFMMFMLVLFVFTAIIAMYAGSFIDSSSIGLAIALGTGFLAGTSYRNSKNFYNKQNDFLLRWWLFLCVLGLSMLALTFFSWPPNVGIPLSEANVKASQFSQKLSIVVLFLTTTLALLGGLPFYPIMAVWHFQQSRLNKLRSLPLEKLIVLQWQTFAYPLPFKTLFRHIIQLHGIETMLKTMQTIQQKCFQEQSVAYSACKLVNDPQLGLPLCGAVAITTNYMTTLQLASVNEIGKAVAILMKKPLKEELEKQDLQLFFAIYPHKKPRFQLSILKQNNNELLIDQFEKIHDNLIKERFEYSIELIDKNLHFRQAYEFKQLLLVLKDCTEIKNLAELDNLRHQLKAENVDIEWLQQGWQLIPIFEVSLDPIEFYRQLKSTESRHNFLNYSIWQIENKNNEESWAGISNYWSNIGKEIHRQWIEVLKASIEQNRELLQIRVEIPEQHFQANGQLQKLQLQIYNESNILVKNLRVHISQAENGIDFSNSEHISNLTLESLKYQEVILPFSCNQAGDYEINGEIIAEELDGTTCRAPFNARLHVGQMGKPYQTPPYALFVTGESLGDDERFIGRQNLIRQLKDFWKQPHGKPAVLLVGQRRIGKTSLLNKLQRMSLEECHLIPIYLNAQSWQSEHEFLTMFIKETARKLNLSRITLPQTDYRPDFDDFLTQTLITKLDNKRILLMIDETEELFDQQKQYGTLAGYLRSIMQAHDYPVLLLFCGAHKLKNLAKQRDSVFFNTTNEFTVSYMTKNESFEILQKNAQDYLDFSQFALEESYRLTHGQPLLLQMLGASLIQHFNRQIEDGESRSNYVDYNDIQQAVDNLVKTKENKAFTDHWEGSDLETQSVLSVFATISDEVNRPHLDIEMIEKYLKDYGFNLNRNKINDILTHLTAEEILQRGELSYSFCVPLYRRWIKARYSPHIIRERFS